jgi:GT2 family glycosyltransferase
MTYSHSGPQPLFSVVIPNWNGAHYLPACLDTLREQTYPNVEIIVADNASTDGSLDLLRDQYPDVRIVALPENRGFTGACNAGMGAARGDYIALLNNDTEVDPGWVVGVVGAFERHPEAGIVASKMLLFDQRDHFHTTGSMGGWRIAACGKRTRANTTRKFTCSVRVVDRLHIAAGC